MRGYKDMIIEARDWVYYETNNEKALTCTSKRYRKELDVDIATQ